MFDDLRYKDLTHNCLITVIVCAKGINRGIPKESNCCEHSDFIFILFVIYELIFVTFLKGSGSISGQMVALKSTKLT